MTKGITEPNLVSNVLVSAATGLFLIFLGSALVDIFPLQVLTPAWQFNFNNRMIGSGIPALIGFCLLHVAAVFNPGNFLLKQRLLSVRQLAIVAAIGFFLLIPLQGYATWKFFTEAKATQVAGIKAANRRFSPIKQAINGATSTADLQNRLVDLNLGIRLQAPQLNQSLPELKKSLLSEVERAEIQAKDRLTGPTPMQIWTSIQSSTRILLASLGFSLAFSAGAQVKGSEKTLLDIVTQTFASPNGKKRYRNKQMPDDSAP